MGYDSMRSKSRSAPGKITKKTNTNTRKTSTNTRKTNSAPGRIEKKRSKKKTAMRGRSSVKKSLEKDVMQIFEKNVFFIAYMNHVLFYNNKHFDKELTREQLIKVKQYFNFKNDMELAPVIPMISVLYNKYYSNDKNGNEIKRFLKIFNMDKEFDYLMIFILKPNVDITEMEGGIPLHIKSKCWILLYALALLLLTYVVNISKNSIVKDLLETSNYIKNIYKNSENCDINVTHDNQHELLKRSIHYLGLNSKDIGIFQNFLGSIECFNERNFEEAVVDELFMTDDFKPINEMNELVPMKMAVVPMNSKSSVGTMSNENTALVLANYKFDKIVETQIVTYVRNGITDTNKIENLLKEINKKSDKPSSEKTYFELMYDTIGKNINQENIAAVLTGNTNYFIKNVDNTMDMIKDTIAKYNIASIKAHRITEKVIRKTTRGTQSLIFLVMMLITWYGHATFCVAKIIENMNKMRILAIENGPTIQEIENVPTRQTIENGPSRRAIENGRSQSDN